MSKRTTRSGVTTIKGRGVTIRVNDRELDKVDAEQAAENAKAAEHSRAFELMDAVEQAKTDLQGTAQVMTMLIDAGKECEEGAAATIERWLQADMAALDRAFDAAWDGIVRRPFADNAEREG
jgi:hypothetical protein